jgi:hypothetical protein
MQRKEPASWHFKTSREHQRPIYALLVTIVNNRDQQRDEKNLQVDILVGCRSGTLIRQ